MVVSNNIKVTINNYLRTHATYISKVTSEVSKYIITYVDFRSNLKKSLLSRKAHTALGQFGALPIGYSPIRNSGVINSSLHCAVFRVLSVGVYTLPACPFARSGITSQAFAASVSRSNRVLECLEYL